MKTHLPKINLDERKWHVIDANGAVLGRLAAQVANILRGKNKPIYTPHMDAGDFVVVINAEKVSVTGKKEVNKKYMTYSGWKGGEKYYHRRAAPGTTAGAFDYSRRTRHGAKESIGSRVDDKVESLQG